MNRLNSELRLANNLQDSGDERSASQHFVEAYDVAGIEGDDAAQAQIAYMASVSFVHQAEFPKATTWAKNALEHGDNGMLYRQLGRTQSIEAIKAKDLDIAMSAKMSYGRAHAFWRPIKTVQDMKGLINYERSRLYRYEAALDGYFGIPETLPERVSALTVAALAELPLVSKPGLEQASVVERLQAKAHHVAGAIGAVSLGPLRHISPPTAKTAAMRILTHD